VISELELRGCCRSLPISASPAERQVHGHDPGGAHAGEGREEGSRGRNIGNALTEDVAQLRGQDWIVAELSSFQLEDIDTFKPALPRS